jgi:hypothetical protein
MENAAGLSSVNHLADRRRLIQTRDHDPRPINPPCPTSQLFSYSGIIVARAERSFGDNDGRTPDRIRRGDCNRPFRVPANLNQSTTKANGVKNGKSRSTGETDAFSTVGLFRAYRCRNFRFHICLVGREGQCAADCGKHRDAAVAVAAVTLSNRAILRRAILGYSQSSCRCHDRPPPQR